MEDLFKILEEKNICLPKETLPLLKGYKTFSIFSATDQLIDAATNGKDNVKFEVKYKVPGKWEHVEVITHRFKNEVSANYTKLQDETFDGVKNQNLAVFFYFSGRETAGFKS